LLSKAGEIIYDRLVKFFETIFFKYRWESSKY